MAPSVPSDSFESLILLQPECARGHRVRRSIAGSILASDLVHGGIGPINLDRRVRPVSPEDRVDQ
jgi:hypothetical protein